MYIAIAAISLIFLISFFISFFFIYKHHENHNLDIRNTFPFETLYKEKRHFNFLILLIISFLILFLNNLLYTVNIYESYKIVSCLLCVIIGFSGVSLFFLPLRKLKEHLKMFILLIASTSLLATLNLILEIRLYRIDHNYLLFIPILIDTLILINGIICLTSKVIYNLRIKIDNEGNLIRPKIIHLAFFEWIYLLLPFLLQISIIVISLI